METRRREELLEELEVLVAERTKVRNAQDKLVELTRENQKAYDDMIQELMESAEPFTKLKKFKIEEQRDKVREQENKILWDIERQRLTINMRRNEIIEELKELVK